MPLKIGDFETRPVDGAGPKRMLRIVPTLDAEPCGNPQMVAWPAGWSTDDILDELVRQATIPR
jgi:hypothetical protein